MQITLDPRTKLFVLLMTIIIAATSRQMAFVLILVGMIAFLGLLLGRGKQSVVYALVFVCLYLLHVYYIQDHVGGFYTMFTAWLSLAYQLYPCCMLSGIIISTTKISEFLSALGKIHVPKGFVIAFSVFLRYIPVIREDWSFIKDSMKMRGIAVSPLDLLCHPKRTIECLYVPLLIAASKAADELTMACITRGIEQPKQRSSWYQTRIRVGDGIVMFAFFFFMVLVVAMRFVLG